MIKWQRRSFLTSSIIIAAGGLFASSGAGEEEEGASPISDEPDGWSSYRGTAANTAYVETDSFPELDTIAWEYGETGTAVAVNEGVVLRTDDGEVHALDAETGELVWKRDDLTADGTPAVAHDTVYVSGEQLTALDGATGDVLWELAFDEGESVASPTVADETVYIIADGSLYAVDAHSGSIVWQHDSVELRVYDGTDDGTAEVRPFAANPVAVADATVYAPTSSSGLVALEATSGNKLWTTDQLIGGDIIIPTEDGIYVDRFEAGHTPGEAYQTAYEGEPEDIGSTDPFTESTAFATSDAVRIVVSEYGNHLKAWDYEREELRWKYDDLGSFMYNYRWPSIAGDTAIVLYNPDLDPGQEVEFEDVDEFGKEPAILGINIEDGSKKWAIPYADLDGVNHSINRDGFPYAVSQDTLYVLSNEKLFALRSAEDVPSEESDTDDETSDDETGDKESEDGNEGDDQLLENSTDTEGNTADSLESNESSDQEDTDVNSTNETTQDETGRDGDPGTNNESEATTDAPNETETTDQETNGSTVGSDSVPGFTTGAGLAGGALSLEWLRRRATPDEGDE